MPDGNAQWSDHMMYFMYMMMQQLVDNGQKRENDANMVRLNAL